MFWACFGFQDELGQKSTISHWFFRIGMHEYGKSTDCSYKGWPNDYLGLPLGGSPRSREFWDPVVDSAEAAYKMESQLPFIRGESHTNQSHTFQSSHPLSLPIKNPKGVAFETLKLSNHKINFYGEVKKLLSLIWLSRKQFRVLRKLVDWLWVES